MAFKVLQSLGADDIFISYTRLDASTYAAGLADELTKLGFSCFIDKLGTDPNKDLPDTLRRKIRSCSMLVVVGTERAAGRETIEQEIREFLATGRTSIVPVNFNDAVYGARWYPLVEGIAPEPEPSPTALDDGDPSDSVVSRIEKQFKYRRRDERLRRTTRHAVAVLVLLLVAIAVAAFVAWQQLRVAAAATATATQETRRATQATRDAQAAQDAARKATEEADAARDEATRQRDEATKQKAVADKATQTAAEKTRLASEAASKAQDATARADAEQARAQHEAAIAEVRSLANRSETLLRQRPKEVPRSLSLAVDSMQKSVAIGLHSVEADTALRDSLALLPRLRRTDNYADASISHTALSPDARHFATLTTDKKLRIYESGGQTPLKEAACDCSEVALSSGMAYAALIEKSQPGVIRIVDLKDDARSHPIKLEEGSSAHMVALSPGGRYLALVSSEGERGGVRVLDAASGKLIASFDKLDISISDMTFGPSGNLAVGGSFSKMGHYFGRVIIWWLPLNPPDGKTEPELTDASFSDFEVIAQDSEVRAVAPGIDNTYFATDTAVWKRITGQAGYAPFARLPLSPLQRESTVMDRVAFSPDGGSLSVVRQLRGSGSEAPRALEVWDAAGHRDVAQVMHNGGLGIAVVGFKPGGQFVTTMTPDTSEGYARVSSRVFQAGDGAEVSSAAVEQGTEDDILLSFSQDAGYIFTTNKDAVMVWDVWGKKKTTVRFGAVLQSVGVATLSPGGKFLALSGPAKEDGEPEVVVYRSDGGSYRDWKRLRLDVSFLMSLSADGRLLAGLTPDRFANVRPRVWEVSSGRDVTPEGFRKVKESSMFALSPSGRYLLAGGDGNQALLLDLSNGRDVSLSFDTTILSLALSPDDKYLALGSEEGIVHVFETAKPEDEIARLQHTGRITAIAFSDDGKYVATASSDEEESHLLRVWLLQPADLLAEAAARTNSLSMKGR